MVQKDSGRPFKRVVWKRDRRFRDRRGIVGLPGLRGEYVFLLFFVAMTMLDDAVFLVRKSDDLT